MKAKKYEIKFNKVELEEVKITSSKDAFDYAKKFYFDDIHIYESMFIILLNKANKTVGFAKISQGGTSGTVIDIKIICKYAVDVLAYGVILIHNHPSGVLNPSSADKGITDKTGKALNLFECKLLGL